MIIMMIWSFLKIFAWKEQLTVASMHLQLIISIFLLRNYKQENNCNENKTKKLKSKYIFKEADKTIWFEDTEACYNTATMYANVKNIL